MESIWVWSAVGYQSLNCIWKLLKQLPPYYKCISFTQMMHALLLNFYVWSKAKILNYGRYFTWPSWNIWNGNLDISQHLFFFIYIYKCTTLPLSHDRLTCNNILGQCIFIWSNLQIMNCLNTEGKWSNWLILCNWSPKNKI